MENKTNLTKKHRTRVRELKYHCRHKRKRVNYPFGKKSKPFVTCRDCHMVLKRGGEK